MAELRIEKRVSALPVTLTGNTMYMVQNGEGFDLYVSTSDGTQALPLNLVPGTAAVDEIDSFLLMGVGNG